MTAPIDVLIPVFNAAETLDSALDSVATQTDADFRVLIVDDGSTDATPQLLKAWAARDPRFTVIAKANGGIVNALNTGLALVSAPFLARMDADDIALPDRFARQRAYLEAHPDCVAVGGRVEHIDAGGAPLPGFPQPGPPEDADMFRLPAREPYIVHPFLMARSAPIHAIGGYRHVPHSEDSDLFWRLADHGRLHNLDAVLGRYRMLLTSISGRSVVNGRTMAVGSQLGALSARRRRAERADIAFDRHLVEALRGAETLEGMCAHVAAMIDAGERGSFKLAAGLKLLELANYRPYEIEPSDCAFIGAHLEPAIRSVDKDNLANISWHLSRAGARLLRAGRVRDAATLVPGRLYLKTLMKGVLLR